MDLSFEHIQPRAKVSIIRGTRRNIALIVEICENLRNALHNSNTEL
jgi:hypothetical protein